MYLPMCKPLQIKISSPERLTIELTMKITKTVDTVCTVHFIHGIDSNNLLEVV